MTPFAVLRAPSQVLFGTGMAEATGRVAATYGRRVLLITDPIIAGTPGFGTVETALRAAGLDVAVSTDAEVDVPSTSVDATVALGLETQPDVVVAVGGGSVIDLAKVTALLLAHGGKLSDYYTVNSVPGPILPLIALPTTAGTGSEATPVAVITDPDTQMKMGVASSHLIPRDAICDPMLTLGAPATVTAHSGIDALSHAIEGYMAAANEPTADLVLSRPQIGKNGLSDTLALSAAGHIAANLERVVQNGDDLEARSGMLYGSLLAGIAFGNSGVSTAHALQFAVGAATHTSHGLGTGLLLPYVMEFNRPARPDDLSALAIAMDSPGDVVEHVHALGQRIGLPASLAAIGIEHDALRGMAEASIGFKRLVDNNPRPLDVPALERILDAAWHGQPARLSEEAASVG
ncbi:alcohol dehydrogenase [Solirubrobacter pauli]|uniref:Alcohol dehydrogenase n=1 Tax=Solirubrobacter pauli TaxID=166793 RepID=A0A660L1F3_9ACTN|nr:iron-containing alcohol dehydrogenase [Solirubrobacter pauli]RKQ86722.1 alcohol dehydrogenase [Solirubrobacter pauli]